MSIHVGRRALHRYLLTVAAVAGGMAGIVAQPKAPADSSPHAAALALVLTHATDQIRSVEPDHDAWWHDTKKRQWTVLRPLSPGGVDSTHWFIVSYAIDGTEVAQWNVDTRTSEIKRFDGSHS